MQVILVSVGSLGDVHPFIAIGRALQARGHAVVLLTNGEWAPMVQQAGMRHVGAGDGLNFAAAAASPNLWHPVKGMGVLWKHLLAPAITPVHAEIVRLSREQTSVVLAAPLMFGARLAQETHAVPLMTAYTAPSLLRTCHAPLRIADRRLPSWMPAAAVAAVWRWVDRHKLHPLMQPALTAARQRLGLPALRASLVGEWMHSPQGGIGLFPAWFAPVRPDWPVLRDGGFPLHDDAAGVPEAPALSAFLSRGSPPVVCMPGSAMRHGRRFFEQALQATERLGLRTVLLTPHADQLPSPLPPHALHQPYASFAGLLPRAAALMHHGGIGSCAQALRAGLPQIVLPMAHDQFDNAACVERLGAGRCVPATRATPARVAAALRAALLAPRSPHRLWRQRLLAEPALPRIVQAVEAMG